MRDDCSLELVAIAPTIQLFTGRMFGQPAVGDKTCNSGVTMICLQTEEGQPHQSFRLQVHQRTRQVDKDGKALSAEHLHGQHIIQEPFCSR